MSSVFLYRYFINNVKVVINNIKLNLFVAGSSYGNGSIEISPSLKNNVSIESKFLVNTNNALETNISKVISSEGGWLCLDKCGVSLFVPDGAIDDDERELFSIEVTDEEWNRPILQEGEYIF